MEDTPVIQNMSWEALPQEIRRTIICSALDLGTSPIVQPWQPDHPARIRPGRWRNDPALAENFRCPPLTPTPLRSLTHISHTFNEDIVNALPPMRKTLEERRKTVSRDRLALQSRLYERPQAVRSIVVEEYGSNYCQRLEVPRLLKIMTTQILFNIETLADLETISRARKLRRILHLKLMPRRSAIQYLLKHSCIYELWPAITGSMVTLDVSHIRSNTAALHDPGTAMGRISGVKYGGSEDPFRAIAAGIREHPDAFMHPDEEDYDYWYELEHKDDFDSEDDANP